MTYSISAISETVAAYGGAGLSPFASPNLVSTRKANPAQDIRDEIANSACFSLTGRQMTVMRFIQGYIDTKGHSPSFREIMAACGIKSTSVASWLLVQIEVRGFIRRAPQRARSIEILRRVSVPTIDGVSVYFVLIHECNNVK